MSTMSQAKMKAVASPNDSGEDDDDVGALIYRESQLRKAEAAAAAAESKKTSNASTHHRTSTRKRTPVKSQNDASLPSLQCNGATKLKRRESSLKDDGPRKKVAKKRYIYECSADGCTNQAQNEGVCIRHGARHKLCNSEGCTQFAQNGGVCIRHGAKVRRCSIEGCTTFAKKGGVCMKHGAKVKQCSSEGCSNISVKGGVCVKHGAKLKKCSSEGCTNNALRGGVCWRHGANHNAHDQSTAFGSEFEMTTATQNLPNQRASRVVARERQEGSSIPEEVAILCREIVEV